MVDIKISKLATPVLALGLLGGCVTDSQGKNSFAGLFDSKPKVERVNHLMPAGATNAQIVAGFNETMNYILADGRISANEAADMAALAKRVQADKSLYADLTRGATSEAGQLAGLGEGVFETAINSYLTAAKAKMHMCFEAIKADGDGVQVETPEGKTTKRDNFYFGCTSYDGDRNNPNKIHGISVSIGPFLGSKAMPLELKLDAVANATTEDLSARVLPRITKPGNVHYTEFAGDDVRSVTATVAKENGYISFDAKECGVAAKDHINKPASALAGNGQTNHIHYFGANGTEVVNGVYCDLKPMHPGKQRVHTVASALTDRDVANGDLARAAFATQITVQPALTAKVNPYGTNPVAKGQ